MRPCAMTSKQKRHEAVEGETKIVSVKQAFLKLLPPWFMGILRSVRAALFDVYANKYYSQEGEDIILQRIFSGKPKGFYVDVGAHHPRRFSNTYLFYQRGWNGINIEPNPEIVEAFRKERKRDINLQVGIASRESVLTYYLFNDPALNTFDAELAAQREKTTAYRVVGNRQIPVRRLDDILKELMPPEGQIDFLTIDVEGLDMEVLQSNDWKVYRPTCVLVESLETSLEQTVHGELFGFMKARNYELFAKTYNTLIFRTQEISAAGGGGA